MRVSRAGARPEETIMSPCNPDLQLELGPPGWKHNYLLPGLTFCIESNCEFRHHQIVPVSTKVFHHY